MVKIVGPVSPIYSLNSLRRYNKKGKRDASSVSTKIFSFSCSRFFVYRFCFSCWLVLLSRWKIYDYRCAANGGWLIFFWGSLVCVGVYLVLSIRGNGNGKSNKWDYNSLKLLIFILRSTSFLFSFIILRKKFEIKVKTLI